MSTLLLDQRFEDAQITSGEDLDLRNVGPKVWPRLVAQCRSTDLRLYHVTVPSLEGIDQLADVRSLTLEWAPKISDLTPLFKLRQLSRLSVFDVPKVRDLEGIEQLTQLVELNLSGSRGALTPKMRLNSLEPVTRLRGLTRFSIANARLEDDDITVLARCSKLNHLSVSNQFDRAQFAFLAKRMNHSLEEPIAAGFQTNISCKQCGRGKFMFHGRRMPILCRSCDEARFEKYLAAFEQLVRDA